MDSATTIGRSTHRGQGLVEFVIVLPFLLLMIALTIDFGRAFYGWVSVHNAARAGATYAATHSLGWASSNDGKAQAEYRAVILREAGNSGCGLVGPGQPEFPDDSLSIGSRAVSNVACSLTLLTPVISNILGGKLQIGASATFPIRFGVAGESPPVPPCFGDATVPDVLGEAPAIAAQRITDEGLIPIGSPTLTTGPRNKVQWTMPGAGCAEFNTAVTYYYKP